MNDSIEVYISGREMGYLNTAITFVHRRGSDIYLAKPVDLIFERTEEGAPIDPTFKLPMDFRKPLFKALEEALRRDGIKPESESKLEGQLQATKYHLEDMRVLALGKKAR